MKILFLLLSVLPYQSLQKRITDKSQKAPVQGVVTFLQVACYMLIRALGRRSIIVFAMAALLILSMVVTYYEAIASIIAAAKGHALLRFGRICT